jgi:hypothetical protein
LDSNHKPRKPSGKEKSNNLREAGCCQGSEQSLRELGDECLDLLMLYQTIIGFSSELARVPNVAGQLKLETKVYAS